MAPTTSPLSASEFATAWDKLRNEIVVLRNLWEQYQYLFASGSERVEVLNFCASWFFGLTQRIFVKEVLLGIARLTDPDAMGPFSNLTIGILLEDPALDSVPGDAAELTKLVSTAIALSEPIRTHRNKYIAHLDRDLATARATTTLPDVRHENIEKSISALEAAFRQHSLRVRNADIDMVIKPLKSAEALYDVLVNSERWKRWQASERENPPY